MKRPRFVLPRPHSPFHTLNIWASNPWGDEWRLYLEGYILDVEGIDRTIKFLNEAREWVQAKADEKTKTKG